MGLLGTPTKTVQATAAELALVDSSCASWDVATFRTAAGWVPYADEIPDTPIGTTGLLDDEPGTAIPRKYPRIKEGLERFLITDINNPGASAKAQSTVVVMCDAWGTSGTNYSQAGMPDNGVLRFNHVPGGSNVLYMDGHVEFVKKEQKFPLRMTTLRTTCLAGTPNPATYNYMGYYAGVFGGAG